MGRLVVDTFLTLDGVMQAPGGPDEDKESGFRHGGWQGAMLDDESGAVIGAGIDRMDALVLGRKTYDIFADYWPKQPKDSPIASKLNEVPKYVASRTRKRVEWRNSKLIEGDVAKAIPQIKAQHKEAHVIGSGDLVQTLLKHELVDRFHLWVYPVVLGTGKRLFAEGTVPARMRLLESKAYPGGAVHLVYEPAGKPQYVDMTAPTPRTK